MQYFTYDEFAARMQQVEEEFLITGVFTQTNKAAPMLVIQLRYPSGDEVGLILDHGERSRKFVEELSAVLGRNATVDRFFGLH